MFGVGHLPSHLRRNTDREHSRRNSLVLGQDGARTDDGTVSDDRPVHHRGAHRDHAPVSNRRTMHDRTVPDHHVIANDRRHVRIHMHDRSVLDVRARADPNRCHVASNDCPVPDAASRANRDIPDHVRRIGDERIVCNGRPDASERQDGHAVSFHDWPAERSVCKSRGDGATWLGLRRS